MAVAAKPAEGSAAEEKTESPAAEKKEDAGKKPYGNVKYADPGYQADGKARYPIDTPEHVKAALSYIAQASNRAKYSPADLEKVEEAIEKAAERFGIKTAPEDEQEAGKRVVARSKNPQAN